MILPPEHVTAKPIMEQTFLDKRVWVVAAWEFKRYFKWKGELFSLALIIALALASLGGKELIARLMSDDPVRIAIIDQRGLGAVPFPIEQVELLQFESHSADDEALLMEQVTDDSLAGILYMQPGGSRVLVFEDDS